MHYRWTMVLAACGCMAGASAMSPDTRFGTAGVVTLDVHVATAMSDAVVDDGLVDQLGRIVTVGQVADGHYGEAAHRHAGLVARRLADGTPDTGFDGDGQRVLDWQGRDMELTAVREQPDGRLLVAGTAMDTPGSQPSSGIVCRLEDDGTYDASFGAAGCRDLLAVRDAPGAIRIIDIELLPDGRILALGTAAPAGGKPRGPAVLRLSAMGKVDLGFGDATTCGMPAPRCGVAVAPASLAEHIVPAALAFDDVTQRIVVATSINVDNLHVLPVLAFDADGTAPSVPYTFTFGPLGYAGRHSATDIHVGADGSTFVTGLVEGDGETRLVVAKLDPAGKPDAAFGSSGRVVGEAVSFSDASASVLQPDGALVVGFDRNADSGGPVRCRLVRFDPFTGEDLGFPGGDGPFVGLDATARDCSARSVFSGGGGLLMAGKLGAAVPGGEPAFILRLDAMTLMRDSFEP